MICKKIIKLKAGFEFSLGKKAWFLRHVNDVYVKRANQMNYRSRASFKLLQIIKKYPKILIKNQPIDGKAKKQKQNNKKSLQRQKQQITSSITKKINLQTKQSIQIQQEQSELKLVTSILDLGCSPGSWSQVLKQLVPASQIASVDLLQMKPISGVNFYKTDARSKALHQHFQEKYPKFELIVSDMAPNFSGEKSSTHQQILQLNTLCVQLCYLLGQNKCNLIMKSLQGQLQKNYYNLLSTVFESVNREKPQSSRSQSSQFFYICQKLRKVQNCKLMAKIFEQIGFNVRAQLKKFKNKKQCAKQLQNRLANLSIQS